MTRQEFKSLVYKNQSRERYSGYAMFLIPLAVSIWFLIKVSIEYFNTSQSSFSIKLAFALILLTAPIAWWGIRRINNKHRTFILISFDPTKLSAQDLINAIIEKLSYKKMENDYGMITLRSTGWQTTHEIYTGSNENELFVDLRLLDNDGIFTWGTKKLKKKLVDTVVAFAKENQCEIVVQMGSE